MLGGLFLQIILCFYFAPFGTAARNFPSGKKERIEQIKLYELYPTGSMILQSHNKWRLQYGIPNNEILRRIEMAESRPVEERIQMIRDALDRKQSTHLYLFSRYVSPLIDVRLLRLLMRIAFDSRNPDEMEINSACDIITFLEKKYPMVFFKYLTPQNILDAYSILGHSGLSFHGHREKVLGDCNGSGPCMLRIGRPAWQHVLRQRLNRLVLTGYD